MTKLIDYGLEGKKAIVTGGSSGIGEAVVRSLLDVGMRVAIFDLSGPDDSVFRSEDKDNILFVKCDVRKSESVKGAINKVVQEFESIAVLVNNAGVERYGDAIDLSEDDWDLTIDTDLKGTFLVSKYAIPYMMKNGRGSIVNIGSIQSYIPTKRAIAYVSSKGGLMMLTKGIALDFAPVIRCNAVLPGSINTPLLERAAELEVGKDKDAINKKILEWGSAHLLRRVGTPQEVANVVTFLASDLSSFITGTSVLVDGGLSDYVPLSTPPKER